MRIFRLSKIINEKLLIDILPILVVNDLNLQRRRHETDCYYPSIIGDSPYFIFMSLGHGHDNSKEFWFYEWNDSRQKHLLCWNSE